MELIITSYNNFYKIKGVFNRSSLKLFQNEFENIFESVSTLIISIEGLESIDRYGVKAIAKLHEEAINKGKKLSIIGFGCKELYNYFKTENAA